eukprot:bmy_05935T0
MPRRHNTITIHYSNPDHSKYTFYPSQHNANCSASIHSFQSCTRTVLTTTLVPTLIIITQWGNQTERLNAGVYFLFYTLVGSLPLLVALVHIQNITVSLNFLILQY